MHKTLPPSARSQPADYLAKVARQGTFQLQVCTLCQTVQYPPRDVCGNCLSDNLSWNTVPNTGYILARTTLHHSILEYFSNRLPHYLGLIKMDCGPSVIAFIEPTMNPPDKVKITLKLDEANKAIFVAENL